MDRWQLREAVAEFQQSDRVLDAIPADDPARVNGFILHCKNDQETATIRRFLGDAAGALKMHRALTAAVREELGRLRTKETLEADVPETRVQLMGAWRTPWRDRATATCSAITPTSPKRPTTTARRSSSTGTFPTPRTRWRA